MHDLSSRRVDGSCNGVLRSHKATRVVRLTELGAIRLRDSPDRVPPRERSSTKIAPGCAAQEKGP